MTVMISEAERFKQFHTIGNDPHAWRVSADQLLATARVLKRQQEAVNVDEIRTGDPVPDEGRVGAVEKMLRGFAVECLLKGLWVKQGHELASGGKFVGVSGVKDQHDLRQLAKAVDFTINDDQKDLFKRLSAYIKFVGRYPIPTQGGGDYGAWWRSPTDDQMLEDIVTELRGKLTA
jgi:hypothetical protein